MSTQHTLALLTGLSTLKHVTDEREDEAATDTHLI